MAMIRKKNIPEQLTEEELRELEIAENKPPVFDEDCPEMTDEMLKQFHRMDLAINDPNLLRKCV